jgi:ABC-type uncharacterized transport system ATPase subunit
MGLLPARGGIVSMARPARSAPGASPRALGIGYAPEERRLFGSFTVQENMLLPAQVLKLPEAETEAAAGDGLHPAAGIEGPRPAQGGAGCRAGRARWWRWEGR